MGYPLLVATSIRAPLHGVTTSTPGGQPEDIRQYRLRRTIPPINVLSIDLLSYRLTLVRIRYQLCKFILPFLLDITKVSVHENFCFQKTV